MSDHSESRLLGLRGLFLEASREGQSEAAHQFAARAMSLNPALALAGPCVVRYAVPLPRIGRAHWRPWSRARNNRHLDRKHLDRRRAVLLTAQAHDLEASDAARAVELALEAHRLAPDFVPAAVLAAALSPGRAI